MKQRLGRRHGGCILVSPNEAEGLAQRSKGSGGRQQQGVPEDSFPKTCWQDMKKFIIAKD